MSKVSFRTRQIDFNRPLSIVKYDSELFYELGEGTFINRGVPSVPSGMEREEENEHHFLEVLQALQLQKSSDISIPVPEIIDKSDDYTKIYPTDFTLSKHFIHIRTIALAEDEPIEYDMDSDDEDWLRRSDLNLPPEKFESMIDRLERGCGQKVMNLEEARLLLKDDPSLVIAVYDYWLNKRVQCRQPLLLSVRQEKRDGGSNNDPYVAFRRRTERMQTRKNRKNDEYSYEKMLILREQMMALGEIMSRMVKRESTKSTSIEAERRIFQLRYRLSDWDSVHLSEADTVAQKSPKSFERILGSRKHSSRKRKLIQRSPDTTRVEISDGSEDDKTFTAEEDPFAFIRIPGCKYQRPLDFRTVVEPDENFSLFRLARFPNLPHGNRRSYTGYVRRRLGRGGRILFDRASPPSNDINNYFQHIDAKPLPAEFHKIELNSWLPVNTYVWPMNNSNCNNMPPQTIIGTPQKESLSQRLKLSSLSQSTLVTSNILTKASSCIRLPNYSTNVVTKVNPTSIFLPKAVSHLPSKTANNSPYLPIANSLHSSPRSVPNITAIPINPNTALTSSILKSNGMALSASKFPSTMSYPSRWVRLPAPAVGTSATRMVANTKDSASPSLEILTSTGLKIVTTNAEAFIKGQKNTNNKTQGLKHSASSDQIQLTFSPGINGGSKRVHDDFHWLPHITPVRKSSTTDEDVGKSKAKNGIISVNPLHV